MTGLRYPVLLRVTATDFDEAVRLGKSLGDGVSANAGAVGGLTSAHLLNRGNQTGAHYESLEIPNENAGSVWRSQPYGTRYRLWLDDSDPANVQTILELATVSQAGDLAFGDMKDGIVLVGRYYGGSWRVVVNAPDSNQRALFLQPVATARATDYEFAHAGIGVIQRGRVNRTRLRLWVDDSAGNNLAAVLLATESV